MKKILIITLFIIICLFPVMTQDNTSDAKDYTEVKNLLNKFAEYSEKFVNDVNKAKNAKQIIKAIDKYISKMEKIKPELTELPNKYPEFSEGNLPNDVNETINNLKSIFSSEKYVQADNKIKEWAEKDEKVMEANDKLNNLFQ